VEGPLTYAAMADDTIAFLDMVVLAAGVDEMLAGRTPDGEEAALFREGDERCSPQVGVRVVAGSRPARVRRKAACSSSVRRRASP
jgi:hypothetical protein